MKFEQVLQIYWTKGFLYNSLLTPFSKPFIKLFGDTGGFGNFSRKNLIDRFELHYLKVNLFLPINKNEENLLKSINIFLSQFSSVNNRISEIYRYSLIRLYLIKSVRGRSHALGKPSRGQRTWSNAWTAYKYNKNTRLFISRLQTLIRKKYKKIKKNYKLIEKKSLKPTNQSQNITKIKNKVNLWF